MNLTKDIQRELNVLLAKVVDSSLTLAEGDRLERLVRGNPERLRYMRDYMQLEVQLQAEATVVHGGSLEGSIAANGSLIQKQATPRIAFLLYSALLGGLAAAVCFVMVVLNRGPLDESPSQVAITSICSASRPPAPVATLSLQSDAKWEGQQWVIGHTFREGDTIELLTGEAQISVGFGAEIATEGPSSLTFLAHDRLQLQSGEVTVHVAEWAKGFTVVTDSMEVVDLGTTFTVTAGDGGKDETRVHKGLVRVHPRSASVSEERGFLVSEGESLTVAPDGRHENQLILPDQLIDSRELSKVVPYHPVELYNTGLGLKVGDEDPHWVIVAGPDGVFERPEYAMVCVPDERYLANAPELSQWVSLPSWRTATANSTFTFQTRFDLTGYDLSTIQLFGRFLADNGIQNVRVNGHAVEVKSWSDNLLGQKFGPDQFRFVDITGGLVQGENVVEIDVWNGVFGSLKSDMNTTPNPMALRVEWCAFGRRSDVASNRSLQIAPVRTLLTDLRF